MKTPKRVAATLLSAATAVSLLGTTVPVNAYAADDATKQWSIAQLFKITEAEKMESKAQIKQLLENSGATQEELQNAAEKLKENYANKSAKEIADRLLTENILDNIIKEGMTVESILLKDIDFDKLIPESISNDTLDSVKEVGNMIKIAGTFYESANEETKVELRETLADLVKSVAKNYAEAIQERIEEKIKEIKEAKEQKNPDDQSSSGQQSGGSDQQSGGSGQSGSGTDQQSGGNTQSGSGDKQQGSNTATQPSATTGNQTTQEKGVASSTEPTAIYFKKPAAVVYVKGTVKIVPDIYHAKGKTTFRSKNTKIATVNAKGKVTAKKKGKTQIAVTNNKVTSYFTVTVKNPVLNATKKTLKKGKTFVLKVKKGKIGKATFTSSNAKVAKVNKKGKITAKKKGKAVITVKVNGVKLKCKITVK